jgi:DNA-directed RNA polymerase specialized sigma24 family protein
LLNTYRSLSLSERAVLLLHTSEAMPLADIAEILGLSRAETGALWRQVRRTFHQTLRRHGYDFDWLTPGMTALSLLMTRPSHRAG